MQGARVNEANFLLHSRHILNSSATFYFKLTNKEFSYPHAISILLGLLNFLAYLSWVECLPTSPSLKWGSGG